MNYKLIASDLDGTLLNSDSQVSQRTREAILAAQSRGVMFVPATGRPLCGVGSIVEQFLGDFPVVTYNGAKVVTSESKRVLFAQNLDRAVAREVYALGLRYGAPLLLYESGNLHVSCMCPEVEQYCAVVGVAANVIDNIGCLRDITKMIWLIPAKDGRCLAHELGAHFAGQLNVHTSHPSLLEFVHAKASKGLALKAIGEIYGIDQSEMIAIGDGFNDASMLRYAGLSVAMGNAVDELKAMCKHVTCSNDEDGVAAVIERFVLQ